MARRGELSRFWLPVGVMLLFACYVSVKLVRSHIEPEVNSIDYTFEKEVEGVRGSILDATGATLSKSIPIWDYHLDPVALTNRVVKTKGCPPRPPAAIVKTIAQALGLDFHDLLRKSHDVKKRYQPLGKSSDPDAHRTLADSSLVAGVVIEDCQVRQYLHHRLMSHVVGFVNREGTGSAGVELKYNRYLAGVPGQVRGMKDAHGRELYDKRINSIDPVPGANVQLTLDHNLQFIAEEKLREGVREFGAGAGWCIVMNARTGAVLAMASVPDFDPLFFNTASDAAKMNRAVAFNYEPGSVMKVITTAAAIDTGRFTPESRYNTNQYDDRYFRLPGDHGHVWEPTMTIRDGVVHSSNIVIGKLGVDLGQETLWNYQRAFGFGETTGVGLPGEEAGILPHWKRWDKIKWSRAPIGQGVSVTAIQLVSAYQAIANDGVRLRPYVVERIVEPNGNELYRHQVERIGRPIKASTARTMREVMLGVASSAGTARRAAIRGYSIAGKTGTAEKANPNGRGYLSGLFCATFCGIVPASDPEIVVLVTLDFDTRQKLHQGGNSAAPIWQKITRKTLRYLMIPPDRPEELENADLQDDDE